MNKNVKMIGFVLASASTVLSVVCAILYKSVYIQTSKTMPLLICAVVAGALALAFAVKMGKELPNFFLLAHVVLVMAGLCMSIAPMVNEIGLVYAGLRSGTSTPMWKLSGVSGSERATACAPMSSGS